MESQHPVRIEEYALIPDSCGAGKWRGGLGIVRSYRVLAEQAQLQLRADRMRFQPYGLAGGLPGRATRNILVDAAGERPLPSKASAKMRKGDLVRHEQAGSGGFGDPLDRDPERVATDVWNEKISAAFARAHHGVVVDEATGQLNPSATAQLRRERRTSPSQA
jgi:N-methylhydantoinase B